MTRERLIQHQQSQGKVKKTRNSILFPKVFQDDRPKTPQERILNNFNLMPTDKAVSRVSSMLSKSTKQNTSSSNVEDDGKHEAPIPVISDSSDFEINSSVEMSDNVCSDSDKINVPEPIKLVKIHKSPKKAEDEDLVPVRPRRTLLNSKSSLSPEQKSSKSNLKVNIHQMSIPKHCFYPSQTDEYECTECNRKFVKSGHLRNHLRTVHRKSVDEVIDPDEEKTPSINAEFYCVLCKVPFSTAASLQKHEHFFHKKKSLSDLTPKDMKCKECHKQFKSQASLKRHVLTEHRGHKTACLKCGESVSRLDNHMASVHGATLVPCPLCSTLLVSAHMSRHIKTVHLHFRQRCVLCDRYK